MSPTVIRIFTDAGVVEWDDTTIKVTRRPSEGTGILNIIVLPSCRGFALKLGRLDVDGAVGSLNEILLKFRLPTVVGAVSLPGDEADCRRRSGVDSAACELFGVFEGDDERVDGE